MKNFLEATATKPTLKLEVVLRVKPVGNVKARLRINDATWITEVTKEETFIHEIGLTIPVDLQIQIDRKHPEALEVSVDIDGHAILPIYYKSAGISTCYINTNDTWKLNIPNFYSWYHEIIGQGWII